MRFATLLLTTAVLLPGPANAEPLRISMSMSAAKRIAATNGSITFINRASGRAMPDDRVTVTVVYRNIGPIPLSGLVVSSPIPAGLFFRGAVPAAVGPELSVDGSNFGPLTQLRVASKEGNPPATPDDVVAIRWRLRGDLTAGDSGSFSFQAVVK